MLDQLTILKLVAQRLDRSGIPYMVTGSIAAGHYGHPRMTRDIDIVVELRQADVDAFEQAFTTDFLTHPEAFTTDFPTHPDGIRAAVDRRAMFNIIHEEALVKVDFIVRKNDDFRRAEFDRRRSVVIDGQAIWMVSVEDLILSKLLWSHESLSEMQRRDIVALIAVQGPALDWSHLEHWAEPLGLRQRLQEFR